MKYNLALTQTEKEVLYHKYKSGGLTSKESNTKVNAISKHLRDTVDRLMSQKKPITEVHEKFRQEFELICMKLET